MNIDLILLSASLLLWGTGEGMFIYFQPIYLQQLGANTMTIAWIFGLFGLAMMVAHIPAGHLSDRIGRKPFLLAAWAIGIPATILMGVAKSLPVFIVGMLIYGLTAFVVSPLNSYITAARGRLSPARAMTLVSAAYNLGAVLGPISGGWVGVRLGLRNVYLISAFIFVISTVILCFLHPQPCEVHDPASPPESLWKNARFISFLGIIFLAIFAMYLPQPLTPRFLQNERGLSLENIGLLGSIGNLGNTVLALALGQVAARSGLLLAQVSVLAFALVLWKSSGLGWYALGYFLLGGYRSARSLVDAQIRPLIHPAQMGLAYGVAETASALAVMLAPLLAGVLYTQSPEMVYWVSALMIGVIVVISGVFAPRLVGSAEQPVSLPPPEL